MGNKTSFDSSAGKLTRVLPALTKSHATLEDLFKKDLNIETAEKLVALVSGADKSDEKFYDLSIFASFAAYVMVSEAEAIQNIKLQRSGTEIDDIIRTACSAYREDKDLALSLLKQASNLYYSERNCSDLEGFDLSQCLDSEGLSFICRQLVKRMESRFF